MLHRLLLIAITMLAAPLAWSQVINQDADGKSSIIAPGGTIGIDVQAASVKANYYSATDRAKGPLLGFDIQGKSENGLANVFSKTDFVPSGRLSALIGYQVSGLHNNAGLIELPPLDGTAAEAHYQNLAKHALDELKRTCPTESDAYKDPLTNFVGPAHFSWDDIKSLNKVLKKNAGATPTACEAAAATAIKQLQAEVDNDKIINDYLALRAKAKNAGATETEKAAASKAYSYKSYFYLRGGINATGFTYDRAGKYAAATTSARFRDTSTVLPFVEVGASGRISGRHFWGVTLGMERISSFALLDKATYKYTVTATPITNGSLSSSKDITAYAGDFTKSGRVYLNADYMWLKPLDHPNYLAVNPYTRFNSQAQDKLYKASLVLGIGAYFLDGKSGKFLGGVYLQSNDISGNTETSLGKTIAFGLIAKLAFSSMFGPGQN